jgi:alpha-aminoadipate carrier protein LysW
MSRCSECHLDISVSTMTIGEVVRCPDCDAELELVETEPPTLALAPEIQEDHGE